MAHILIVEDEVSINRLISKNLTLIGHTCASAYDGPSALQIIRTSSPDLIILDVMLPGLSGFDLIPLVGELPVIFVTAKAGLEDKLKGLSLGAEDYVVKPFEMQELLARVRVVLRRTRREEKRVCFDGLTLDLNSRKVFRSGGEVELTPKEFSLLETLVLNRNIALSREKLIELVWGFDYMGDTRTVDVHVQQLRQKLGLRDRIRTVYKMGYRFEL
ncbi:MAG: response regulator transcription factor [Clostridia bacterium]|nr:response regulator transcription factor [Clostridia bacterium]